MAHDTSSPQSTPRTPPSAPLLWSIEATASALSVDKQTVIRMLARRQLDERRIGRRRLVTAASLNAFVHGLSEVSR
jgi:hypothetical protein